MTNQIYNVGYELYEEDEQVNPRGAFLIEAPTQESAMQHAGNLLSDLPDDGWNFTEVVETEWHDGDIPVIVAD